MFKFGKNNSDYDEEYGSGVLDTENNAGTGFFTESTPSLEEMLNTAAQLADDTEFESLHQQEEEAEPEEVYEEGEYYDEPVYEDNTEVAEPVEQVSSFAPFDAPVQEETMPEDDGVLDSVMEMGYAESEPAPEPEPMPETSVNMFDQITAQKPAKRGRHSAEAEPDAIPEVAEEPKEEAIDESVADLLGGVAEPEPAPVVQAEEDDSAGLLDSLLPTSTPEPKQPVVSETEVVTLDEIAPVKPVSVTPDLTPPTPVSPAPTVTPTVVTPAAVPTVATPVAPKIEEEVTVSYVEKKPSVYEQTRNNVVVEKETVKVVNKALTTESIDGIIAISDKIRKFSDTSYNIIAGILCEGNNNVSEPDIIYNLLNADKNLLNVFRYIKEVQALKTIDRVMYMLKFDNDTVERIGNTVAKTCNREIPNDSDSLNYIKQIVIAIDDLQPENIAAFNDIDTLMKLADKVNEANE